MFKLVLEKSEDSEIKLPASAGSYKKQKSSRKNTYFCFIDYAKAFDCVDHNKLWKILRDGNTRPPALSLEKLVCRSGSNSKHGTWSWCLTHKASVIWVCLCVGGTSQRCLCFPEESTAGELQVVSTAGWKGKMTRTKARGHFSQCLQFWTLSKDILKETTEWDWLDF